MVYRKASFLLLAVSFLLLPPSKAAGASAVQGIVRDPSGGVLPGVTVSLYPATSQAEPAVAVTDLEGAFVFTDVAPGTYRLELTLPAFEPKALNIEVGEGGDSGPDPLEVVLGLAGFSETVTVRDEAKVKLVTLEESSGEKQVENDAMEAAPLTEERFQDALPLLPSVVRGPDGLININGARSSQSGLLLNGANVTDPVTGEFALNLPLDAVESVKVYQNVYSAEFGQVSSGTTNVRTRAGGDRWRFSFNNFLPRPRAIDGHIAGIDKATPRFRISGPIARGRLWISQAVNYRFVRSRVDELPHGSNEEILESFDAVTQLDYQIDPRNLLSGVFTVFPSDVDNLEVSTLQPFEASPDMKTRGFNFSIMEQATVGRGSLLQTLLSVQKFDLSVRPKRQTPARLTVERLEGNYFNRTSRDSVRVELKQSLTTELGGEARRHTLQTGYALLHTSYDGTDAGFPVDLLRADGSRFQRIEWVGDPSVGASNTEIALFVQDRWRPSEKLQLDLGLRYDHEQIAGEHHLAPRVSASFSPFGDQVTVIKGGLGLFYDKMLLNVGDFERRQRRRVTQYEADGQTVEGVVEFRNTVDFDRLHVPRSVNWHLELDRLLNQHWMLRVKYSERHGSNELIVEPLSEELVPELRLSSRGGSRARELELTLRSRFGEDNEMFFSYVRARTEGDLNDFSSLFANVRSPLLFDNEFSLLPFDYGNRFLLWGVVHAPKKIILSPVLEIREGFPTTRLDELHRPLGARNRGGRFPYLATFDLKVTKDVSLPVAGWRARVGLQFFNLFNHFNPRDIQSNIASPIFGALTNSVDRQIRLKFTLLF